MLGTTAKGGSIMNNQPSPARSELAVSLGERRHDLDWVRIGAFLLLIFYHVGMYYVSWDWHVKSAYATDSIAPLMFLTNPWRLALLFLVSGVATAYLLERQGKRGFLAQRSVRLLIPLVFGMAVIVPPQSYLQVVEKLAYPGSYFDFLRLYFGGYHGFCKDGDCLRLPTWNHLWFVAYLWVYTVVLYVVVRAAPATIRWLRYFTERRLGGTGIVLWPIVFLAVIRITLFGRFPQTNALAGDWYNHALYGMFFLAGFSLAGTRAPWATIERARWFALGFAILGWAFISAYSAYFTAIETDPSNLLRMSHRIIYAAEQWLAVVAVLGFARRHLVHDNAARRYLTNAIFPIYILHQTIIVVLAHNLKPANLNPGAEALLLILVTATLSLLGYEVIRRVQLLRPLFGLALRAESASKRGRSGGTIEASWQLNR
jgi:glucans biosynthesis protein C